jgi:hypothetical protein
MFTANNNRPSFDEQAGVRAAFALPISFTTLRQVESHVR